MKYEKYEQHELSAAFPAMGEGDLMLMTQDIREHGLREPGVIFEGKILDGWHRYLACTKAKVEFVATEFTGDDPTAFVISKNRHRRHMNLGQMAVAVAKCQVWAKVGRPFNTAPGAVLATVAQAAEAAGTSVRTMHQAKAAEAAGLGDAVRDGQLSVKEAAHIAAGTTPKSSAQAPKAATPGAGLPAVPPPDALDPDDSLNAIIVDLQERIAEQDALLEAFEKEDRGAELVKLIKMNHHYRREIGVEQDKNVVLLKQRDDLHRWQNRVCDACGELDARKALAFIRTAFIKARA